MPQASAEFRAQPAGSMVPEPFEVISKRQDTTDTWTLELAGCADQALEFAPGQFTMLAAGGAGEVPISISGDPDRPDRLVQTVRVWASRRRRSVPRSPAADSAFGVRSGNHGRWTRSRLPTS